MSAKPKRQVNRKRNAPKRRKVFVSFHIDDKGYRKRFTMLMDGLIEDRSVDEGDIEDANRNMQDILREVREEHIADSTVIVVLLGPCTWRRRFIDWEIHASLRDTRANPRLGLLGIVLPSHTDYKQTKKNPRLMPPRLADNIDGDHPYAKVYDWPEPFNPELIARWINEAFQRRKGHNPNNSLNPFVNDRKSPCAKGWQ